jgi:YesN/AraC family two-component response regulator
MKILIADDSDLLRQRVGEIVASVPDTVIYQARDGLEALRLNEVMSPEIVVLDIRMPGKNGLDVLKEIKSRHRPPTVIMLTNYPYPQYRPTTSLRNPASSRG